jgi:ribosomal protein S18 acetylase RimI-like enzyme
MNDLALYHRGTATAAACWQEFARGAEGAAVHRLDGVVAAVFPDEPERSIYNNAVLEHAAGVEAMEAVYAETDVANYAAWVHESDTALRRTLEKRGYVLNETTRAMGMCLEDVELPRPLLELGAPSWRDHMRLIGVPENLLAGVDPAAFELRVVRAEDADAATALAYDHDGDCGIYNVTTLEHARRRGLGTALTALHIHDAVARGCVTATLQATEMAESMYARVGFRDLGLILEYVPPRQDAAPYSSSVTCSSQLAAFPSSST